MKLKLYNACAEALADLWVANIYADITEEGLEEEITDLELELEDVRGIHDSIDIMLEQNLKDLEFEYFCHYGCFPEYLDCEVC